MDLRTKLVFALVAVALGSMFALGGFTYRSARDLIERNSLEQLDGIAESKKNSVEKLVTGWHERVQLIASRNQLRESLRAHNRSRDPRARARIRSILGGALNSTRTIESLAVFDSAGRLLTGVRRESDVEVSRTPLPPQPPGELSEYQGLLFNAGSQPRLVFVANLVLEGEHLGVLHSTMSSHELVEVVQSFVGLGETGESLIVARDDDGEPRLIHPVRHRPQDSRPERLEDLGDLAGLALRADTAMPPQSLTDYRGEQVWAAVRFLPETEWGLIVKRDRAELRGPVLAFRQELLDLGLTLGAFAILLGTALGLRFARPIHHLAMVADRIREGEMGARAEVMAEDEIGQLARNFNNMTEELESRMSELNEFHKYFDLSPDMLCIAGTDGYFKRVNPAFQRVLGWTPDQLLSRPFFDLIHPDDLLATQREVERLADGIPTVSFENRYRTADGDYKHLLWTAHPEDGEIYSAARDVTELRQAQQQLESARAKLRAGS